MILSQCANCHQRAERMRNGRVCSWVDHARAQKDIKSGNKKKIATFIQLRWGHRTKGKVPKQPDDELETWLRTMTRPISETWVKWGENGKKWTNGWLETMCLCLTQTVPVFVCETGPKRRNARTAEDRRRCVTRSARVCLRVTVSAHTLWYFAISAECPTTAICAPVAWRRQASQWTRQASQTNLCKRTAPPQPPLTNKTYGECYRRCIFDRALSQ